MKRRVAVRGIAWLDDRLLGVKLRPHADLKLAGDYFCLPGGTLELGEGAVDGLHREMLEETGVAASVGHLFYIQQFAHNGTEHLELFFHISNAAGYQNVDLATISHGAIELSTIAFVRPDTVTFKPDFLRHEPIGEHIAANEPPKLFNLL